MVPVVVNVIDILCVLNGPYIFSIPQIIFYGELGGVINKLVVFGLVYKIVYLIDAGQSLNIYVNLNIESIFYGSPIPLIVITPPFKVDTNEVVVNVNPRLISNELLCPKLVRINIEYRPDYISGSKNINVVSFDLVIGVIIICYISVTKLRITT